MNWQKYWNNLALNNSDPFRQVARTGQKVEFTDELIQRITNHIIQNLEIKPSDKVLDVCCGNGMLSQVLAANCKHLTGCDISEELIKMAQAHFSAENITYLSGDARQLSTFVKGSFDKINLYFSFQYFDTFQKGFDVIREMKSLIKTDGKIFIGDVPDYDFLQVFYPSYPARFKYHIKQRLGKSEMGKFWKEAEMARICERLNLSYQRMDQPNDLPYAAYRVDYLLS